MSGHTGTSVRRPDEPAILAALSRVLFGERSQQDPATGRIEAIVDGVRIEATADGQRTARLVCTIQSQVRVKEHDLRTLMGQYLPYCDVGADVLCADPDGCLLLIAEASTGDDLPVRVGAFCDAAVHWTRIAARQQESLMPMHGSVIIIP